LGAVRALQGVNLGPIDWTWALDYTDRFRRIGVPSVRVHDAPVQMRDVVDLHCVFAHPRADPDDPSNYYFAQTDDYLAKIREAGAEVYFRLGETIELSPTKRYADPSEWTPQVMAAVCANIVRHYNPGWNNGHEWGIRHWEFWNEPDGGWWRPAENRAQWTAGADRFFDFYAAVAPAVKAADPTAQIGLAGFTPKFIEAWLDTDPQDVTACEGWGGLLPRCLGAGLPIDFVSWHHYPDHWQTLARIAAGVRQRLDAIGLAGVPSHLTEWNYVRTIAWGGEDIPIGQARRRNDPDLTDAANAVVYGPEGAALAFGCLAALQDAPIDLAHFYTANSQPFGIFGRSGRPRIVYYGLEVFGDLARAGDRVRVQVSDPDAISALAVSDGEKTRAAVAHLAAEPHKEVIDLPGAVVTTRWLGNHGWTEPRTAPIVDGRFAVELPGPGIADLIIS
jgi:hypothetical protein